jgi:hypothetical protein
MTTFKEANQIRVKLKMKLSDYSWYSSSSVLTTADDCYIAVFVKRVDDMVKNTIPKYVKDIPVKIISEN